MSDEADIAAELIERQKQAAIMACSQAPTLVYKGSCWFCDEPLPKPQKFCDADCSADYEQEQAALKRAGKWQPGESAAD